MIFCLVQVRLMQVRQPCKFTNYKLRTSAIAELVWLVNLIRTNLIRQNCSWRTCIRRNDMVSFLLIVCKTWGYCETAIWDWTLFDLDWVLWLNWLVSWWGGLNTWLWPWWLYPGSLCDWLKGSSSNKNILALKSKIIFYASSFNTCFWNLVFLWCVCQQALFFLALKCVLCRGLHWKCRWRVQ